MTNIQVNEKRNSLRQYLIGESERLEKLMDAELNEISMASNENVNSLGTIILVCNQAPFDVLVVHFTGIQFHSLHGHVVHSTHTIKTVGGITQ